MKTIKKMKPAIIIAAIILLFASCSRESQPDNPKIMVFLVDDIGLMDTSIPMLTDRNGNPQHNRIKTGTELKSFLIHMGAAKDKWVHSEMK